MGIREFLNQPILDPEEFREFLKEPIQDPEEYATFIDEMKRGFEDRQRKRYAQFSDGALEAIIGSLNEWEALPADDPTRLEHLPSPDIIAHLREEWARRKRDG